MKNYIYCAFLLIFLSCANVIPPNGGPKDLSPPIVLKLEPENNSINFQGNMINIHFNENVILQNTTEVYAFPESNLIKKINSTGKTIEVILKKELSQNTTYVITFNGVIQDLNEGNVLNSLKYTFSTGELIDSAFVYGQVINIRTNGPIKNSLVGLYNGDVSKDFDSIVRSQKPDFFSFTNSIGKYSCSNLKTGLYTLFSVKDENLNLTHEINEMISMPTVIELKDSIQKTIEIFLDKRAEIIIKNDSIPLDRDSLVLNKQAEYGLLKLLFDPNIYMHKNNVGQITKNQEIIKSFYITDSIVLIEKIEAGIYQLQIVSDLNGNKKWDSGNIKTLHEPEKIYFFPDSIKIRPNWELNLTIKK